MTTDPGDLVLDPTCGSGTTAHVAEQWGRRWITTDTSRVALNIAKTRLMTASYPWYTAGRKEGPAARALGPAARLPLQERAAHHPGFAGQRRAARGGDALRSASGRSRQAARRRPVHRRDAAELRAAGSRGRRGGEPRPRAHGGFPGTRFRAPEDCRREERRARRDGGLRPRRRAARQRAARRRLLRHRRRRTEGLPPSRTAVRAGQPAGGERRGQSLPRARRRTVAADSRLRLRIRCREFSAEAARRQLPRR
ncbi:MAG: hypothetical protein IPL11_12035, partial [Candidatus Accumulibacter sp.]|nr:hypothetical protein [Accumulibacter sp.]